MSTKLVLRIILAAFLGEIALIIGTSIAQAVIVDGLFWNTSSLSDLLIGGSATLIAGIIAGLTASLIVGKQNYWPHIIISILIMTETTYLILSGKLTDPLWFDLLSGLALIMMVWIGYLWYQSIKKRSKI